MHINSVRPYSRCRALALFATAFVAISTPLSVSVRAAIPSAATADWRYNLGYLVVTHYSGVDPTGNGDSTAGIQQALDDCYAANVAGEAGAENGNGSATKALAVFFPPGTYKISSTLRCYEWRLQGGTVCPNGHWSIIGSTEGGTRPVIRFANNSAPSTSSPKPLIAIRHYGWPGSSQPPLPDPTTVNPVGGPPSGWAGGGVCGYYNQIKNLDFDCNGANGNAGAIGVTFSGAQNNMMANVKVIATGALAGFYGLPGAGSASVNLEVVGGQYGLLEGSFGGDATLGALTAEDNSGAVVTGVILRDQTVAPLRMHDYVCAITVCGFHIYNAKTTPLWTNANVTAQGSLTLLDGVIEMTGAGNPVAVSNPGGKGLYLRNVYVSGTTNLVTSNGTTTTNSGGTWKRITEYAYNDTADVAGVLPVTNYPVPTNKYESYSLINGTVLDRSVAFPVSPTITNETPPADVVSRHLWTTLPSYNGSATEPTVTASDSGWKAYAATAADPATVVVDATLGANNTVADTTQLQAAIDQAAAGNGRVFLPSGVYTVTGTISLAANTVLMGSGLCESVITAGTAWMPTSGEVTVVQTADSATATTYLGSVGIRTRTINTAGDVQYSRFNGLHWRAGRNSIVAGAAVLIMLGGQTDTQPRSIYKITGNGGGRWYAVISSGLASQTDDPAFRRMLISGTSEPLWFYGFNVEHGLGDYECEITGASNVRLMGMKREGSRPTLRVHNSSNIAAYSKGANGSRSGNGAFQVTGTSDDVLFANLIQGTALTASELADSPQNSLYEAVTGQPVRTILYPHSVSLYKRGELDDAAMIISGGPSAPAAPSGLTATNPTSTTIDLDWVDNSSNETGFEVDRALNSGFSSGLVTNAYTAGTNATGLTATGLSASTTYYFRARATNATGDSTNSNTANATTTSGGGGNLVTNPGFESALGSEWTVPGVFSRVTGFAHAGTYSLKATANGSYQEAYQNIPVTAGQTYTISGWVRVTAVGSTGNGFAMSYKWLNSSGGIIGTQVYLGENAVTAYVQKTWSSVTAPAGAVTLRVICALRSEPSPGVGYFDDVSVTTP